MGWSFYQLQVVNSLAFFVTMVVTVNDALHFNKLVLKLLSRFICQLTEDDNRQSRQNKARHHFIDNFVTKVDTEQYWTENPE